MGETGEGPNKKLTRRQFIGVTVAAAAVAVGQTPKSVFGQTAPKEAETDKEVKKQELIIAIARALTEGRGQEYVGSPNQLNQARFALEFMVSTSKPVALDGIRRAAMDPLSLFGDDSQALSFPEVNEHIRKMEDGRRKNLYFSLMAAQKSQMTVIDWAFFLAVMNREDQSMRWMSGNLGVGVIAALCDHYGDEIPGIIKPFIEPKNIPDCLTPSNNKAKGIPAFIGRTDRTRTDPYAVIALILTMRAYRGNGQHYRIENPPVVFSPYTTTENPNGDIPDNSFKLSDEELELAEKYGVNWQVLNKFSSDPDLRVQFLGVIGETMVRLHDLQDKYPFLGQNLLDPGKPVELPDYLLI